jgi:hypothetical protein
MLKVVLVLLGLLVLSILVVVAAGYVLPVEHEAARSITLRQKPEDVFALISDFKNEPSWRPDVESIEMLPDEDGHARFREKSTHGTMTMIVMQLTPPQRMETEIAGKDLPFGGQWIFEILPTPDGCRMNITEHGEIYNPVFRFVSRFVIGYTGTLDGYLKNVARKFGESAVPQDGQIE